MIAREALQTVISMRDQNNGNEIWFVRTLDSLELLIGYEGRMSDGS